MPDKPRRNPMRERFRDQVREQVKDAALAQLADGGAQAISLNAIAKSLAVTGPALYRYFASRDELLSALIVDAYRDLHDALARDAGARDADRTERIRRLAHAYRSWALAQPHRYELLFKPPLPGYAAHAAPLAEAARSLMGVLLGALAGRIETDDDQSSYTNDEVLEVRDNRTEEFHSAVRTWSRLHGFVSLELGGSFAAMQLDADALFDSEAQALTA